MRVSVIGTGRMGKGLVKVLGGHVPSLQWGSRSKEHVQQLISSLNYSDVIACSTEEALQADVVIHSLWFRDLLPWAEQHKELLKGKILVDIVNPFTEDFSDFTLNWGESAAEELQKALPQTTVVGAFKNTFFSVFDQPTHQDLVSDVFVTSDDEQARHRILELFNGLPFRFLDAGTLRNNRVIERMTLFEREIAIRYGTYPYVSYRLFGLNM